jgi:hypothetical protein
MDLYSGLKSMTENVRRSAANEPDSVDGPMFPLIFSRYLSFAPTSPDKKRREIWGTPNCFARKDVGDPTGYLTLLVADYTRSRSGVHPFVYCPFLGIVSSVGGATLYICAKFRWLTPRLRRPRESM